MNAPTRSRSIRPRFALFAAFIAAAFAISAPLAQADTEAPPAPPTAPAPGAVVTPPAPPTQPGNQAPENNQAPKRREEEAEEQQQQSQAPAPGAKGPNIFERAAALMKGKDSLAATIKGLEKERDDCKAQLDAANRTIAAQNAELAELRAGRKQLADTIASLEGQQRDTAETVASLGFPPQNLPGATTVEQAAENSEEALLQQFRAEKDDVKKGELAARLRDLRNKSAK